MPTDFNQLKLVKDLGRKEILLSIARQPQSSKVYVGASDGRVYYGDVLAEKPEFQSWEGHTSYVSGLALVGNQLISGSYDGHLIWRNVDDGQVARNVEAHSRWIRRLAASQDGKHVASIADDMVCKVWNAQSGELIHELKGHEPRTPHFFPSMLYACGFSPDGAFLATADRVGKVIVWDVASGKQAGGVEAKEMYTWDPKQRIHSIGGPRSVAFSPDGNLLAVGGMGQVGNIDHLEGKARVEVFDWRKATRTNEFVSDGLKGLVERLVFHPQGEWLLAAGGDNGGHLQFLQLAESKVLKQEKASTHIHDLVLDESAETIYLAAHGKLQAWTLKS